MQNRTMKVFLPLFSFVKFNSVVAETTVYQFNQSSTLGYQWVQIYGICWIL